MKKPTSKLASTVIFGQIYLVKKKTIHFWPKFLITGHFLFSDLNQLFLHLKSELWKQEAGLVLTIISGQMCH